jgi:hypothetical protein
MQQENTGVASNRLALTSIAIEGVGRDWHFDSPFLVEDLTRAGLAHLTIIIRSRRPTKILVKKNTPGRWCGINGVTDRVTQPKFRVK